MTYHEITVVDLKMHPTPMYLLQTGSSSVYSTIYSQAAILAVKRRQNPLSWTGSEYCNFWSMKRCIKWELPSRALIWSRQKPKGAFRNHGTYWSTPAQPPGRRHYAAYTNLKAHWHLIRCQCGNHGYSVNFHDLRLLLTFALLNTRQPRFKLSLATGRGGRFPSHDLPHIYGMDSIILLRCSTVPGFTIWVWILSQRSAWGISITYSASAIWKSQTWYRLLRVNSKMISSQKILKWLYEVTLILVPLGSEFNTGQITSSNMANWQWTTRY